jgi:hypothetical protein
MANQGNSTCNSDMFQFFKDFMEPKMDMDSWANTHRKNTELLNQAARSTVETFRHIAQLQGQYANQLMQQANSIVHGLTTPGKWEDKLSQTAEMAQSNMQTGVNCGRQMAEKIQENHNNLIKMFGSQFSEHMNEASHMARKNPTGKK